MQNRLLLLALMAFVTTRTLAQGGAVLFANRVEGVIDAPFYNEHGPLAGSNYLAQLYAGTTPEMLAPVGIIIRFDTNGYFFTTSADVPVLNDGSTWVQVRAWETTGGATFEQAAIAGYWTGISDVLFVPVSGLLCPGVPCSPVFLWGLRYPGQPLIVQQPQAKRVHWGERATLSVAASCGVPLSYQWFEICTTVNDSCPIQGATNRFYTTPPLTNSAQYWVSVSNALGVANSKIAEVSLFPTTPPQLHLRTIPSWTRLQFEGLPGAHYQVEYTDNLPTTNWLFLTNVTLRNNSFVFNDYTPLSINRRFYRVVTYP